MSMPRSFLNSVATALWRQYSAVWRRLWRWRELAAERRELALLDDRMLKDIGITWAQAQREARRPFWDDPEKATKTQPLPAPRSADVRSSVGDRREAFATNPADDSLFCRKPL